MASLRHRKWKTKSGQSRSSWEVSWYEGERRRKKLFSGPAGKTDARCFRGRLESARPKASPIASLPTTGGPTTVLSAGERWVRHVQIKMRRERSTWEQYQQHLENHIYSCAIELPNDGGRFVVGKLTVAELTPPHCEALGDALLAKLSVAFAARVLSTFRMLMNDVVRRGERPDNPAQTVRIRQQRRGEDKIKIPTLDEMRAIREAISTTPPMPPTFEEVWCAITSVDGLRPSENRGAAVEDLVLDGALRGIQVLRRADQWNKIGRLKSDSGRRFVPLGPQSVALLKRWLLVVPQKAGFEDPEQPGRILHLLFPTSIGTTQTLANIYHRMWVPLMARAGLVNWVPMLNSDRKPVLDKKTGKVILRPVPRYPLNSLRHFAASLMIDQGFSPKKVQTLMGHSSIQVTYDRYGHLFERRDLDSAEAGRLESALLK